MTTADIYGDEIYRDRERKPYGLMALLLVALLALAAVAYWKLAKPAPGPYGAIAMSDSSLTYGGAWGYADPLADVIVNLAEAGNGFPWHFDTNNYTVTLAIQNAESGGDFEYSPHLRSATDENYEGVTAVLDGDQRLIRTLRLEPGDLQIFKGRYSLHRVTPLGGARSRYVAIFSFADEPNMVGSPERTRQLYGRVLPVHLARVGLRADSLID